MLYPCLKPNKAWNQAHKFLIKHDLLNAPFAMVAWVEFELTLEYCRDTSPDLLFKLLGKRA